MPEDRVAVTGASGLLGSALVRRLERDGAGVLRLVRREARGPGEAAWNPPDGPVDAGALRGVSAVVHLAGENVGTRWTAARRRRIRESRVDGTALLARTLAAMEEPPRVLVQASAVGIYGDRGDEPLTEASPPGSGFFADLGAAWEGASGAAAAAGIRVVRLRFGVVLSAAGGALERLLLPFRMGVGGRVGSGRQFMPWISRSDAVEVIVRAIRDPRLEGAINAVAGSARNAEFTEALGRAVNRPALLPVPAFALRAVFGEMADHTLLASHNVIPARLRELGHGFVHPTLDGALRAAIEDTA
jgi:uncharacterized protein